MAANKVSRICIQDHLEKHGSVRISAVNRRQSYDVKFKLAAIACAELHNNVFAAEKFGVNECSIRLWRKQKDKLSKSCSARKAFRGPKTGRFKVVDLAVRDYCLELRSKGLSVTREELQLKANETARNLGIPRSAFKASLGWVRRFMVRVGFCLRRKTSLAQKLPQDYEEQLVQYQRYIIHLRKVYDYPFSHIGNADETPVFFEMPSNHTVSQKGVQSVIVKTAGHEKKRCTVMLCVLGDGRKLPPFVIFKRKTMPKETFPSGIIVRVQENGWMNEALMIDWLKCVWNNRPGAILHPKSILSLDTFKGHLTDNVRKTIKALNSELLIIPGGMTSQLQVLDVCINKPFKDHLRKEYKEWLVTGKHDLTPSGKIKKPACALICKWILSAWAAIDAETIKHGFKKCCLTNSMDGTEDDLLWEEGSTLSPDQVEEDDEEQEEESIVDTSSCEDTD